MHRIIKARDQVYKSALSGSGRADDGDRLPGCDLEADIRENADPASGIGKVHVLEAEAARDDAGSGCFCIFRIAGIFCIFRVVGAFCIFRVVGAFCIFRIVGTFCIFRVVDAFWIFRSRRVFCIFQIDVRS